MDDSLYVGLPGDTQLVPSLQGLESLEQVGGLSLNRLGVSDLSGLHSLRRVRLSDQSRLGVGDTSDIGIYDCPALIDLHGLEQLEDWDQLAIENVERLVSLDGLTPPLVLGRVDVRNAPALRDVSALSAAHRLSWLWLAATGLQNLDGSRLKSVEHLVLADNSELVNMDGLNGITWLEELFVLNNDALQRLPLLPNRPLMTMLQVTGNDSLQHIPAYWMLSVGVSTRTGDELISGPSNEPKSVSRGFQSFVVGDNASLQTASAPVGFATGNVVVYGNPNLKQLDLAALTDADLVSIRGNAQLADVDVSALDIVKRLEVADNPLLPLATFDGVAAAVREMSQTSAP